MEMHGPEQDERVAQALGIQRDCCAVSPIRRLRHRPGRESWRLGVVLDRGSGREAVSPVAAYARVRISERPKQQHQALSPQQSRELLAPA